MSVSPTINDSDVLFGAGERTNTGNLMYRDLLREYTPDYERAGRDQKTPVAQMILDTVKLNGGRFLSPIAGDNAYTECTDDESLKKIKTAFQNAVRKKRGKEKPNLLRKRSGSSGSNPGDKPPPVSAAVAVHFAIPGGQIGNLEGNLSGMSISGYFADEASSNMTSNHASSSTGQPSSTSYNPSSVSSSLAPTARAYHASQLSSPQVYQMGSRSSSQSYPAGSQSYQPSSQTYQRSWSPLCQPRESQGCPSNQSWSKSSSSEWPKSSSSSSGRPNLQNRKHSQPSESSSSTDSTRPNLHQKHKPTVFRSKEPDSSQQQEPSSMQSVGTFDVSMQSAHSSSSSSGRPNLQNRKHSQPSESSSSTDSARPNLHHKDKPTVLRGKEPDSSQQQEPSSMQSVGTFDVSMQSAHSLPSSETKDSTDNKSLDRNLFEM